MAKPYYEDFNWFMKITFEQYSRSREWLTSQVQKNVSLGIFTTQQGVQIWSHFEDIMKKKVDDRNAKLGPRMPIIDLSTDRGDYIGSATAPKDPPKEEDLSWWDRFNAAMTRASDKLNGDLGAVGDKLGDTLDPGKWFNIVVLIGGFFLVLKLFKK